MSAALLLHILATYKTQLQSSSYPSLGSGYGKKFPPLCSAAAKRQGPENGDYFDYPAGAAQEPDHTDTAFESYQAYSDKQQPQMGSLRASKISMPL